MASEKEKKKGLSSAEKKELKKQKDEMEEKYTTCLLDGRKEKVGNFRVEPPGLFRGRGEHPKKGALKVSIKVTYVVINTDYCSTSSVCVLKTSHSTSVKTFLFLTLTCRASGRRSYMIRPLLGSQTGQKTSTAITNMSSLLLEVP